MEVVSIYPFWTYLLCFLIAGSIAFFFYRKDKRLKEFPAYQVVILAIFRFLSLAVLAILLLSPLLKYFSKTIEEPIIIIAQDNSQSVLNAKDSAFIKGQFQEKIAQLSTTLEEKYQVEQFTFDQTVYQSKTVDYTGKVTNYDALFEEIEGRFTNQNIGGMLLASDGIYNQGSNPNYMAEQIDFPIYTIALGDTTSYKDASLLKVRNNEIAFLGNEFPLEINLRVQKAKGELLTIKVIGKNGEVFSKGIEVKTADHIETLRCNIEAKSVGVQKFRVVISTLKGERNVLNNSLNFYIDVIDGRQRIALLGVAPHPDIAALKRSIAASKNYELVVALLDDFDKKLKEFDLVILHQSVLNKDHSLDSKIKQIINSKLPLLLIGGGWDILGVQFGIKPFRDPKKRSRNEVFPLLNPDFTLFTVSEGLSNQLEDFPPLLAARSNLNNTLGNTVLLNQKIGSVATKFPLLEFFEKDSRKIGRWYGENMWKWSMNDFVENKSYQNFDELIRKTIQFLAVKADRSLFRVATKNEYYENEAISFDAQLFNQSYELINDAEVSLLLKDEEGKEYPYSFSVSGNAYRLAVASLQAGQYDYTAVTTYKGKEHKEGGRFTVKALQLEQLESVADHNLLYQLAKRTGGEIVYPDDLAAISDLLKNRKDISAISYQNEEVEDIINLKWIFFILITLLAVEWFIRKRGGAY